MKNRLGIIGFCHDENSSFMRGTAAAPQLIRKALFSDASNLWTESGVDLGQPDIFFDAGDLDQVSGTDATAAIENSITLLLSQRIRPLSLGGDHSITYPIVRALAREYPELSLLHFDAHPDLYDDFQGNRHSHACPFARIMEEKLVQRLVQVGIRTMNGHQRDQARRFGVEVIEMKELQEGLELNFDTPLYVSVDMDVLDPAFAPGVSHREPGGLSTRQLLKIIQGIRVPVVGADIVEFNPQMDLLGITATVCAKILKELSAVMVQNG